MNHNKSYRKLGRRPAQRKAMMKSMTISLIKNERIETTVTRAKELRKFAEKMITLGKKGSIHNRRTAFAFLRHEETVAKIFKELAPKYAERNGGYTRMMKKGPRRGDGAEVVILELV